MNVSNTNWTNVVNTMLQGSEIEGADKIQASAVQGANGDLVVSFKGGDGQTYTFTAALPELDEATGEPTPEAMAAFETKLDKEIKEFEKSLKDFGKLVKDLDVNANSTGTNKVLFDIYALMNLMLEIAQKQREAARNERKADLDRAVQDIKNQADIQREAARLGVYLAIGMAVVNIGLQLGAMAVSNSGTKAAYEMEAKAGVDQVAGDLKLLTAKDGAATQKNLNGIESKLGADQVSALKTGTFKDTCEAKTELDTATNTYGKAVEAREGYMAKTEAMKSELPDVESKIEAKTQEVGALEQEVQDLEEDFAASTRDNPGLDPKDSQVGQELAEKKAALETARGELKALQTTKEQTEARLKPDDPELARLNQAVDAAETKLTQAKTNFEGKANADLTRLDGELAQERIKLDEMKKSDANPKPTDAEIKAQEKKIGELEQQRTWGRAYATDVKMKAGMKESIAADIKNCETIVGQKMDMLKLDGEYRGYMSRAKTFEAAGQLAQQIGSTLNGMVHNVSEMEAASATEKQAESKVHENMQQESEDLAQSAVQLLKSVLDLLRQVLEAENQSIRQIVA
ncbi:MAG: hypothetical protein Q4G65_16090 [bacterium]|nr:hypothetical protein [bacterium]